MRIEDLMFGLKVTVIGMGIVFASLYVLQLVMIGFRKVFYDNKAKTPVTSVVETAIVQEEPLVEGLSPSVVVAITAAVAMFLGGRPANIVSIKRDADVKTAWQQVARANAVVRKSN
ncbi:MAG: OadG family protein [Bacillota bacterium]|nr:OadG family protein [Bacillota bacterium]